MSGQFTRLPTDNSNAIRINPYKHKKTSDDYCYQGEVYLTPKRPMAFKYFDTLLFKFEIETNGIKISRRMSEGYRTIVSRVDVDVHSKQQIHQSNDGFVSHMQSIDVTRKHNYGGYDSKMVPITIPQDVKHVCVQLEVVNVDNRFTTSKNKLTSQIPAYGYTWIRCIGGQIRVHKKTLSHHIPYFKQLFTQYTNNYYIHVQLMDLCELIYYLPPYTREITTGFTYGAFYRLSEHFRSAKLADICDRYLNNISAYSPLTASFIAFEGGVEKHSKLYLKTKKESTDEEMRDIWTNEFEHRSRQRALWYNYRSVETVEMKRAELYWKNVDDPRKL